MSLAFIRQCQHYGPVSCIWTPLLIPLGMKWIQWAWLDQFFYLFSSALSHCYALDYSLFLSTQLFLELWHCTLFHICVHPSMFKLLNKRIKEYVMCPRTTYSCISFIFLLYYFLINYMLFVPSQSSFSLVWSWRKQN